MILGREFGVIMATFGERLKDLRTKKHLTQSQLADALGVSKQAISQYENGIRTPKDYEQIALLNITRTIPNSTAFATFLTALYRIVPHLYA
jgi:transcriptional regulator with XRE-family HTH domain